MGWYSRAVLPSLLDWVMAADVFTEQRRSLLARASGRILEIGFGTGLNVPHYSPERVTHLVGIDINPGTSALAERRIAAAGFPIERQISNGENLPFRDRSFDCVVSTWTLCSIRRLDRALAEIYRVLQSGGSFLFIEHGLSPRASVRVWQHRLTPVQQALVDGCHLNRNISAEIAKHDWEIDPLDCFSLQNLPELVGYTYRGSACKP
ncbi:MAG: class I SAM-dependent methyltransferase [Cyanobacteria bacterium J06639_1]